MAKVTSKLVPGRAGKNRKVWLCRWREGEKLRERSFKAQKEAKAHAAEMERLHEGKDRGDTQPRDLFIPGFEEAAKAYLAQLEEGHGGKDPLDPHTLRTYRGYLQDHVYPHLTIYKVSGVTAAEVETIRDRGLKAGVSNTTAKELIRLTRAVLKYSVRRGWIGAVPGAEVRVETSRKQRHEARQRRDAGVFTPDHIRSLIAAADSLATDHLKRRRTAWALYRPMLLFFIHTGARLSEVRGFSRAGFDKKGGVIRISQRAGEDGEIGITKSADGLRSVPLHPDLVEPMEAAMRLHNHDLVFSTGEGEARNGSNLWNRMLKPLIERANELAAASPDRITPVPELGFHAIRHAYASRLIAAGANLKQLQTWMGHHDPAFTLKVYGHLFHDEKSQNAILERMTL